jgi:hypothetical protein
MRKKVLLMILLGLGILSRPNRLQAQDGDKVVILSPRVGAVINAKERERFQLFEGIPGFASAIIHQTAKGTYYADILLTSSDGSERHMTLWYSETEGESYLSKLAERIDHFEDVAAGRYQIGEKPVRMQVGRLRIVAGREELIPASAPICVDEMISELDLNTPITLILKDSSKVSGRLGFIDIEQSLITVEQNSHWRVASSKYPLTDIAGIEYTEKKLRWGPMVGGLLLGATAVGVVGWLIAWASDRSSNNSSFGPNLRPELEGLGAGAVVGGGVGLITGTIIGNQPKTCTIECK